MPAPSPYDLSSSSRSQTTMIGDGELQKDNQPLIGGSMDTVNEKQVSGNYGQILIYFSSFFHLL